MYTYKGDLQNNTDEYSSLESKDDQNSAQTPWLGKVKSLWKDHQLLSNASPTISACTTATNLSALEFQSNSTIFKEKMATLQENLRIAEIEPLQKKEKELSDLYENESEKDVKIEIEETRYKFKCGNVLPQLIAAIAVGCVSFIIGYSSAYTSAAAKTLIDAFELTDDEFSWVSGLMPLGAIFGGVLGGPLIEYAGRKKTLLLTDLLFLGAWALTYFAQHMYYLYVSRSIAGISVGIASLIFPVYLGETIQPEIRGILGLLPTAFGNIAMLACAGCGFLLEWRGLSGVGAGLALPFLLLFVWIIPETPQWYISKGRVEESRKALQWLRGDQDIEKEFDNLVKTQQKNDEYTSFWDLLSLNNLRPLVIILGLMFFQQFSGINAVIFYTTTIFEKSGSNLAPNICTAIVYTVNFISTFIATVLIDALGRKILLYISAVSMIITMSILGVYFYLLEATEVQLEPYGWVPLASFVVYVLGFSLGFGPVPWLMMGEILPSKVRGAAGSVSTSANWLFTFIVTKTFFFFVNLLGIYGVYWLFSGLLVVSIVFILLVVPETKGQSLEEIERKLAGLNVRRISSVTNLKPMPSNLA